MESGITSVCIECIDDLASDQILIEAHTQLGNTVVNELSIYGHTAQIEMVLQPDCIILRSPHPFSLGRFRQRLQVNFVPVYLPENYWCATGDKQLSREDAHSGQPLKTYNNRYLDEAYMEALDATRIYRDKDAEVIYNEFCKQDIRWAIERDVGQENPDREWLDKEVDRRRTIAAKWFKLGYSEMMQRRRADLHALESRERPVRSEWMLSGDALDLRFFNRGGCALIREDRRGSGVVRCGLDTQGNPSEYPHFVDSK